MITGAIKLRNLLAKAARVKRSVKSAQFCASEQMGHAKGHGSGDLCAGATGWPGPLQGEQQEALSAAAGVRQVPTEVRAGVARQHGWLSSALRLIRTR